MNTTTQAVLSAFAPLVISAASVGWRDDAALAGGGDESWPSEPSIHLPAGTTQSFNTADSQPGWLEIQPPNAPRSPEASSSSRGTSSDSYTIIDDDLAGPLLLEDQAIQSAATLVELKVYRMGYRPHEVSLDDDLLIDD